MTENPKLTLRYLSLAINCRLRLYLPSALAYFTTRLPNTTCTPVLFLLASATSFFNGSRLLFSERSS